jgi:hypothetical protein
MTRVPSTRQSNRNLGIRGHGGTAYVASAPARVPQRSPRRGIRDRLLEARTLRLELAR